MTNDWPTRGWPLVFHSQPPDWNDVQVGDCWYDPDDFLVVMIPSYPKGMFPLRPRKEGWSLVTGLPKVTFTPSINAQSGERCGWHGWIRDGRITPDCEGRVWKGDPPRE